MEVSRYISWLNSTILRAGGMASCSYILTADPVLGKITAMRCAPQHSITQFEGTPPLRRKSSRGDIRWCTTDGRKGLQPQQRHHRGVLWPRGLSCASPARAPQRACNLCDRRGSCRKLWWLDRGIPQVKTVCCSQSGRTTVEPRGDWRPCVDSR